MKKEITYNHLWEIEQDIAQIRTTSPALYLVNEKKFLQIMADNAMHFKVLHTRMKEIQKRFLQCDEEGNPIVAVTAGPKDWLYLPSATNALGKPFTGDEVKEEYFREAGAFLNRHITIIF